MTDESAALVPRQSAEVSTDRRDPRDDWPDEAKQLRDYLTELYGERDPLPTLAGAWIARQKSRHTRRAYSRGFKRWEEYTRSSRIHPLEVKLPLADAYANHLTNTPSPRGGTLSPSAQAQALAAAGSFYTYAVRVQAMTVDPFTHVQRPTIDPDYSPTQGLTAEETGRLIQTARDWNPRSYALIALLYLLGPRVDEILSLNADQIGYDRGHRTLPLTLKRGKRINAPVPPLALDALLTYLDGREDGPMFTTDTGRRWTQPEVWKHLRVLARRAGIPQAKTIKPHALRHGFITDSLEAGVPLERVQDAVGHSDPRTTQRYNRRRRQLDDHPTYSLAAKLAARLNEEEEEKV
ncbi:tyrosine-type recombinase/integrase [Streptomyces sp. NBC_01775]|uniref:tyrosine-type recombinase/integrase n=1 Tax=Streptomyces sp. NBC_01775 TaxID=2975939 RepID=UPI002DD84031|nr:tyrosine-type recombinase/integrase [Streptomyces sp. NBC_01775]WSB74711.1 tyrosine-type recombinase/integrase [Streptomyces sp. NBC_01775]